MNSTRKKDIQLGKKNLLADDEFDPKYGKERISLMLDSQVIEAFKAQAEREGKKYQVLIREALRDLVFGTKTQDLEKRLKRLEREFFKRQA